MTTPARQLRTPESGSTGRPPGRWTRQRAALRRLTALAVVAGSVTLAAACAGPARPAHIADAASPGPPAAAQPASGASQPAKAPGGTATPSRPPAAPSAPAAPSPPASGYAGPHFDTPQAAMVYLASAYNSGDTAALHAVTMPQAFRELMDMRAEAVNLRLRHCVPTSRGDYTCYFRHDYPASMHKSGHGAAVFTAAPALNPGWYMYLFNECG